VYFIIALHALCGTLQKKLKDQHNFWPRSSIWSFQGKKYDEKAFIRAFVNSFLLRMDFLTLLYPIRAKTDQDAADVRFAGFFPAHF
jgi:hypothetical protein